MTFHARFTRILLSMTGLLLPFGVAAASPEAPPTSDPSQMCIQKSLEEQVTSCDSTLNMKRFKKVSRAKVGTRELKDKLKKKAEAAPGLDRQISAKVVESLFKRKKEKKKIGILKEELRLLSALSDSTANDDPEKADVLRRVADGYKNYFDQLNFLARDLDEKIYQAKKKGDKKTANTLAAQQKKLEAMTLDARKTAVKAYVQLKELFPDYPDYDEVLFAIGYELGQLAMDAKSEEEAFVLRAEARENYNELIRNHPRSRFIPHAWMAYGEYYFFEEQNADKSLRSYEKVTKWGAEDNPNYIIAMYYQAWCLFNLQEYEKTIQMFKNVIDFAKNQPTNAEAASVAKRSKLELVDAFSKIGNPSQAWIFFQRIGEDQAHPMLKKLADVFYNEGQWGNAIIVLHKLQALEAENYLKNNSDDLCHYQHMVTNAVINSKPKADQLVEMKRQLALYHKFKSDGKHDPEKMKQCAADTVAMTWDQATHWHLEAVGTDSQPGTKDAETMKAAIGLYETILDTFKDWDDLKIDGYTDETQPSQYRVAYYIADLYWTQENWDACGPAFDKVLEVDPKGPLTAEAAYGSVLCYNKVYVQKRAQQDKSRNLAVDRDSIEGSSDCGEACQKCKKKCPKKRKAACQAKCEVDEREPMLPRELTDLEKGILNSYDRYVCFVSAKDGTDYVNIKYRRARIYYEANHFAEAAVLFKEIALNHSDHELGLFAANLYLDCLNALGDLVEKPNPNCYDDLADIIDVFMDKTKAPGVNLTKDEEFASQMKSLKVGVLRKKAESLNKQKRFKESAETYLTIYRNFQGIYDDKGMCEVLFNTAINMEAARLVMPAIKVRQKMIQAYPDCEHTQKATYFIGQNYHALQSFTLAAENYYAFAEKYPGEKEAPDALSNAIMFYIGLGEQEKAWTAVNKFQSLYKSKYPDKAATVFFSAGYIYLNDAERSKRIEMWEPVRKHFNQYVKRYGNVKLIDEQVQALVLIADSYWKQRPRDLDRGQKYYKKALQLFDQNAMDKVTDNKRKAEMLNASASARYAMAERKFHEFKKVRFPEFNPEREIPKRVHKWWKKKMGKEAVAKFDEMRKYRRILVNWGEMARSEARKETKKEDANIQFEYWLEHRFKPWMDKKTALLEEANKLFATVVEMHVPEYEMAASARAGDMQIAFMNALYDAPLPPAFKGDEELITIYRQSMDEKAEPFRKVAISLYERCLTISTKVRWFNDDSKRCEAELNTLDPKRFPVSEEIRIQPNHEIVILDIPGPILKKPEPKDKKPQNEQVETFDASKSKDKKKQTKPQEAKSGPSKQIKGAS